MLGLGNGILNSYSRRAFIGVPPLGEGAAALGPFGESLPILIGVDT